MIRYTFQITNGSERRPLRTASSTRLSGKGIRTNDCDRFDSSFVQGQKFPFVLQQNHAGASRLERSLVSGTIQKRNSDVGLLAVQPSKLNRSPQNAPYLVVNGRFTNRACLDHRQEFLTIHELSRWHLQIEAAISGGDCVVRGIPIRHQYPGESPFLLNDVAIQ